MSQTNAIILRIKADRASEFERLFKKHQYPNWQKHHAKGGMLAASLTRVAYGSQERDGVQDYVIVAVFHGMSGHTAHDSDDRFNAFLPKARAMQPSQPYVWGGTTIHARPESIDVS